MGQVQTGAERVLDCPREGVHHDIEESALIYAAKLSDAQGHGQYMPAGRSLRSDGLTASNNAGIMPSSP